MYKTDDGHVLAETFSLSNTTDITQKWKVQWKNVYV
jgi:hypothetical protein